MKEIELLFEVTSKKINIEINETWSTEVDRRRIETGVEIINELRESNELIRCEIAELKQKNDAALVVTKKMKDELKLELSAKVYRK